MNELIAPRAPLSRRVWLSLPLVPAAALLPQLMAQAQSPRTPNWFRHVQWRVKPGKREEFEKYFLGFMKSYHQARKDAGMQKAWILTKLVFPSGEEAPYHYSSNVLTETAPDLDQNPAELEPIYRKLNTTRQQYTAQMAELATVARTAVSARVELVGQLAVGHVARVDFAKIAARNMAEYINMERTIYKPLREDQLAHGTLTAWSVSRVVYPGGTSRAFDAYTLQAAKDFPGLQTAIAGGAAQFMKVHPNQNLVAITNRNNEIKEIVSTNVIRVLAMA